ncbi:MAG: UDP-N-acetylglucosamine diphosphorylase/glucosamine-1-phosphate N-acetyltransferase [Deltaproteobacteria bacterium]|nr:UDP-N-acetylglucosamine diphosphorylase/glucosamine-1-phosphate N-acetyltransferase [Deltaproteobacteria bacterium]
MTGTVALVLAAGHGKRMKSARPKVLHEVAGRPLYAWPTLAALEAGVDSVVVVVGYGAEAVKADIEARFPERVSTALQPDPRGTGDAVKRGMAQLPMAAERVLILYGDCPMIRPEALTELAQAAAGDEQLALLTARVDDPAAYGRILRDADGKVSAIREAKDCSEEEARVDEVNPGLYLVDAAFLRESLAQLGTDNAQGEILLTDVVAMAAKAGGVADAGAEMSELLGVNDRADLALAQTRMRERIGRAHCRRGVGLVAPELTFIDASCVLEPDCVIEPGVHLRGDTRIAAGARIGAGCVLTDVIVDADANVLPYSVASQSHIGPSANVGPFAHLRPGSELLEGAKVGNFCETKKTRIGKGSKVNHLSYVGDGLIGEGVNIGAGTIFCNYDGKNKHQTVLEDGVFIGSDSQLVAPVTVGAGAYVASGTTVTRDVPADALAVSRTKQENKEGYAKRLRARFAKQK